MNTKLDPSISRRRFLVSTSMATSMALLAPRHLLAQDEGLVQTARKTAAAAKVTVQKLRGNISVLMGAGGNIAVLPGRDGALLIDAGFAGARPQITSALSSISSDPIKHLINTHWHFDHTDGNSTFADDGTPVSQINEWLEILQRLPMLEAANQSLHCHRPCKLPDANVSRPIFPAF